jgi:hypothetical protein
MKREHIIFYICLALLTSGIILDLLSITNSTENLKFLMQMKLFVRLFSLIIIVKHGTLIKSKYATYIHLSFLVILLGTVMKIMHSNIGTYILLMGMFTIMVLYGIHFYYKTKKGLLDILKLIYIVSAYLYGIIRLLHNPSYFLFYYISSLVFNILFAIFTIDLYKKLYEKTNPPHN